MWSCPHCGTPQAETARCWVCRRSSTTCSTCRNFRPSVSADLGYCALDRRRRPLTGRELRGCWEAATAIADPASGAGAPAPNPAPAVAMTRDFIPIEELTRAEPGPIEIAAAVLFLAHEAGEPWAAQTSLFGDVER